MLPPQLEQIDPNSVIFSESTVHALVDAFGCEALLAGLEYPPVIGAIYSRSYHYNIPDDIILSGDSHSLRGHSVQMYIDGGSYAATQSGMNQMYRWRSRGHVHYS